MPRLTTYPGYWYCEALPSGAFAALSMDELSLLTHLGTFPTPAGRGPLYVRITDYGGVFRAIGQAQDIDATQEYIEGIGWSSTPPGPFGVSGAIYDNFGARHIATPQSGIGSQGWRYVTPDNQLITGDATYFDPTYLLNQYTVLPNGFLVGQDNGGAGLIVVTLDGVRRLIYAGNTEMPRSNADASGNVAIAFYVPSPGSATAVMLQTTYAELQALPPLETNPEPPEPPNPEPPNPEPIPPVPNPEPVLVSTGGVIAMSEIKSVIQHFGTFPYNGMTALRAEPSPSTVCWSVQPNGDLETRPQPGGSYEMFVLDGQIGSVQPDPSTPIYSFVLANVSGL